MEIKEIVELIKKIHTSLIYTAPEAMEEKYELLAEKYQDCFIDYGGEKMNEREIERRLNILVDESYQLQELLDENTKFVTPETLLDKVLIVKDVIKQLEELYKR